MTIILIYLLLNSTQGTKKIQTKIKPNTNISKSANAYTHDKTRGSNYN